MEPDRGLVLEMLGDAVITADRGGKITYANPAAEELLGWPAGALRGLPLTAIIPPHLRTRHTAGFNRYRSSWAPRILGKGIRVAARRKNGSEVRIELTVTAFRGRGGEELYAAILRDLRGRAEPERSAGQDPLRTLCEVLPHFTEPLPPDAAELGRRLTRLLEHRFSAAVAQIWLLTGDGTSLELLAQNPTAPRTTAEPIPLGSDASPIALAARTGDPSAFNEGSEAEPRSTAYLPLSYCGELLGVLSLRCHEPITEPALLAFRQVALHTAAGLHAVRGQQVELEREDLRRRLNAVSDVLGAGLAGEPLAQVLELGVARALEITGYDEGFAALCDGPEGVVQASLGSRQSLTGIRMAAELDVVHLAVRSGETTTMDDYAAFPAAPPWMRQRGVQAAVAAPLRDSGGVLGAIQIATRKRGRGVADGDRDTLTAIAAAASAALLHR